MDGCTRFDDHINRARRHPEVLAIFGEPRRMLFHAVLAAILRGAQESARTQDDDEAVA
jgi:hypothetical protein